MREYIKPTTEVVRIKLSEGYLQENYGVNNSGSHATSPEDSAAKKNHEMFDEVGDSWEGYSSWDD